MPLRPRVPAARSRAAVSSLAIVLALAGCRKGGESEAPEGEAPTESADAANLPAFDVRPGADDQPGARASARPDVPYERFYVEVGDAPTRGPDDAPVTIVAFYDFECPYCERGHRTMQQLEHEYAGKVRIAYKAFPLAFHAQALLAALAVRSAQAQGKFWAFHDYLFSVPELDLSQIDVYARAVGLDLKAMADDVDTLRYGSAVRRDLRQGLRLGVRGTPAYFINGRPLSGARPIGELREVIEQELSLAEGWRAKGIAADKIYAYAIADGFRRVEYTEKKGLSADGIYRVPLGDSPVRGNKAAPVTIVAFTDFECPYCARGHETLEKIRERYGDKVRVVFKHLPLPFHSHAYVAARAALAAGEQGKFWEYHDRLFAASSLDEDTLLGIAKALRLDRKKIEEAMGSTRYDAQISADIELAREIGVRGTPAYFVNGRAISGAVGELEFRMIVQEELERAQAKLAEGVAPAALYEALTAGE
ncbi:MAG: thioredoxin domain-containing protein [Myxococcales bacterium]|nr:thioredoxin domain-containing protein [Myxococcales bacterium]